MKKIYLLFLLAFVSQLAIAQQRYIDPIFPAVNVVAPSAGQYYGGNATILTYSVPTIGQAVLQGLSYDLYTPAGDTKTDRPVVVYFHSGNFLPYPQNGGISGRRSDSTAVEICTRLAKMGYVALSADYRLGWSPTSSDQTTRVFSLINAAWRGVQDANTMVRYLKRTVAEFGNPLGIDPAKICLMGQGTGGYISLAAGTLDTVTQTYLPKFFAGTSPMVYEPFNGNVGATTVGIVPPAGYPPPFVPGDTLCYPNHVGYSNDFQMSVNLGGALGDLSWINAKSTPTLSFQNPIDPYAPYNCAVLTVPPPFNLPVVEVCGAGTSQPAFKAAHVNDVWQNSTKLSGTRFYNNSNNGGTEGLFAFNGTDSAPWDIWAWNNANIGTLGKCDSIKARKFIDTIIGYFAPRACLALNLGCTLVDTKNLDDSQAPVSIFPNPAQSEITFEAQNQPIESIYVYDLTGRLVKANTEIRAQKFVMQRNALPPGMYFAELRFAEGTLTKQIVFE